MPRPPPARDPSTPTWAPSPTRPTSPPTPAVLLHGLGIGLPPYLWTVAHLLRARSDRPIALVCLPEVSLRAVFRVPSPDDLVDACKLMETMGFPMVLHTFASGVKAIRDRTQSDDAIAKAVADHVAQAGPTSAFQLARANTMSGTLAREQLLTAEQMGLLCRDDTVEGLVFHTNRFLVRSS